jgi:hypothetical protein
MPGPGDPEKEMSSFRDSAIEYEHSSERFGNVLVLEYSLKTLRDHVPAKEVTEHLATLDNIYDDLGYRAPKHPPRSQMNARSAWTALLALAAVGVAAFVVRNVVRRRRSIRPVFVRRGEGPASAIDVADKDAMRRRPELQSCRCGKQYNAESLREEHLMYDGNRITVLRIHCDSCNSVRDFYFRMVQTAKA